MNAGENGRRKFEDQGFVVVENVISPSHLMRMRRFLAGIERRHSRLPPYLRSRVQLQEPSDALTNATSLNVPAKVASLRDVALFGPPFEELIFLPRLLDLLEALFDDSEFNFRYAGLGVRLSSHPTSKAEAFHREAGPRFATEPKGVVVILPLETMDASNGGTRFVRESHRISDEEAMQASHHENFEPREDEVVTPTVEAGSALFFGYKVFHAAGPMSPGAPPRRTILMDWLAPAVLPTTFGRRAYDGIRPRSQLAEYQKQLAMSFPWRFENSRLRRKNRP